MKKWLKISMIIPVICWFISGPVLLAESGKKKLGYFTLEEYQQRRAKVMDKIPEGMMIVLGAQMRTSYHRFFQNNDFMYLSGIEIPNAILVLDGINKKSLLFYSVSNREARTLGIKQAFLDDPCGESGMDSVHPYEDLEAYLDKMSGVAKNFYTFHLPEELAQEASREKSRYLRRNLIKNPWDQRLTRELQFVEHLKRKYPKVTIKRASGLIWDLREIKTPAEIKLLRIAGKIGVKAHLALMKAARVGQPEYELAAVFEYICKKNGAHELAYNTLICTDENHAYPHYQQYDRILKNGDFLVVDGGPDYHYYDTDITVSFPANGKFTPRQREIYEASWAVHRACLSVYRPGLTGKQVKKEVNDILKKEGFDLSRKIFKNRMMQGGFGHYVGMAVHDVKRFPRVLKEGMVFANEPMAIFTEEKLGVRVESTILITKDGCENLTPGLPRTVEEIEAFMKKSKKNK